MFIAADHEGGDRYILDERFLRMSPAMAVGDTGNRIVYRMPEADKIPVFSAEGEVVQRSICHSIADRMNDRMMAAKCFITMCASFGFLNYMDNYALKYVSDLKKYDISDFHFKNIFSGIVDTDRSDVKGTVYFNEKEAVIFIINLSGQYLHDLDFKVNTEVTGWEICEKPRRIERIEPYEYIIFTLKNENKNHIGHSRPFSDLTLANKKYIFSEQIYIRLNKPLV